MADSPLDVAPDWTPRSEISADTWERAARVYCQERDEALAEAERLRAALLDNGTPRKDADDAVTVSRADLRAALGLDHGTRVDYYEALDRLTAAAK